MHEESSPAAAAVPTKQPAFAPEAVRIFLAALCGGILATSAYFMVPKYILVRDVPIIFAFIVSWIAMAWAGSLAMRSLWAMEGQRRAWLVMVAAVASLHAPLLFLLPYIWDVHEEISWMRQFCDSFIPLLLPVCSVWILAAMQMARRKIRKLENSGVIVPRGECVRLARFWLCVFAVPLILFLPLLLFVYSLPSVVERNWGPAKDQSYFQWRSTVVDYTPALVATPVARLIDSKPNDFYRLREGMRRKGLMSSTYLIEKINAEPKDSFSETAFEGLKKRYPEDALKLSREIWKEQYLLSDESRFVCAAEILAAREPVEVLMHLLREEPSEENGPRRRILLSVMGSSGRGGAELTEVIESIAQDRVAAHRLNAIHVLTHWDSTPNARKLLMEFFQSASLEQHWQILADSRWSMKFGEDVYLQALNDSRKQVLRCWLTRVRAGPSVLNSPSREFLSRLLELTQHADLRVRRHALRALASSSQSYNIPYPGPENSLEGETWWLNDSSIPESQDELIDSTTIRESVKERLERSE